MRPSIRALTRAALMAAVVCVLSLLALPMPSGVPLTLQTFAIALAGYLLGARWGAVSIALYLLIGAIGLPVFAGATGGVAKFVSVTGGFLAGFLPLAALCGLGRGAKRLTVSVIWGLLGLIVCHLFGALQFAYLTSRSIGEALVLVSAPYLVKDALSVLIAALLARILAKRLKLSSNQ